MIDRLRNEILSSEKIFFDLHHKPKQFQLNMILVLTFLIWLKGKIKLLPISYIHLLISYFNLLSIYLVFCSRFSWYLKPNLLDPFNISIQSVPLQSTFTPNTITKCRFYFDRLYIQWLQSQRITFNFD